MEDIINEMEDNMSKMYNNPNATLAGVSFTCGKARFHAVNVSEKQYFKALNKEGRSYVRLFPLPGSMSRADAAAYVLVNHFDALKNDDEIKELHRVAGIENGQIRRYHGYTNMKKVYAARAEAGCDYEG